MHVLECSAAPDWLRAPAKSALPCSRGGSLAERFHQINQRIVAGKFAGLILTTASRCRDMTFKPRDLEITDYDKGFLQLLEQLTVVGDVSREAFKERLKEVRAVPDYKIIVIEDEQRQKVIATAALLIERKFIRNCAKVGHIEDVCVDQTYRGKRLGQRVIDALVAHAKQAGCYKVILDCGEANVAFYEKCGLERKEVQMAKYF